jgi:geranylgeranyl pyrophosphate synthase
MTPSPPKIPPPVDAPQMLPIYAREQLSSMPWAALTELLDATRRYHHTIASVRRVGAVAYNRKFLDEARKLAKEQVKQVKQVKQEKLARRHLAKEAPNGQS